VEDAVSAQESLGEGNHLRLLRRLAEERIAANEVVAPQAAGLEPLTREAGLSAVDPVQRVSQPPQSLGGDKAFQEGEALRFQVTPGAVGHWGGSSARTMDGRRVESIEEGFAGGGASPAGGSRIGRH